jgi:hypothetical protein
MDTSDIAGFCEDLRRAREFVRVSLADIANSTRITPQYLEALENGRWDEIPQAYLLGYLGLYADAVGMNREKVLGTFRRLTTPDSEARGEIIIATPPLVRQPELVGVTRAKVSVSWLAHLSMNRKAAYFLTALALTALVAVITVSRTVSRPDVVLGSLERSLTDYKLRTHGSYRLVPLDIRIGVATVSDTAVESFQIHGKDTGRAAYWRDDDIPRQLSFVGFDTIEIQYLRTVTVALSPPGSAALAQTGAVLSSLDSARRDTAVYKLPNKVSSFAPDTLSGRKAP